MRLDGIRVGDVVEVDRRGRRFHAIVDGTEQDGLKLTPIDSRVSYYSCRSREVVAHWARRGRPRQRLAPVDEADQLDLGVVDAGA